MESTIRLFWQRLNGAVHPEDRVALTSHPHTFDLRFPPPAFIGDVDHAPLVVLMLNGGVAADLQAAEFPTPGDSTEYIDWLNNQRLQSKTVRRAHEMLNPNPLRYPPPNPGPDPNSLRP